MERSIPFIVFYFVAHLVILVHAQNATLVNQTCKKTPNYYLCVSTLKSDPRTRLAKDIRGLATIFALHVMEKATQTRNHIAGLLKDPSIDRKRKQLLGECMEIYNAIIMNWLSETLEGLLDKDYGLARDSMAAVPTNIESCEKSFRRPIQSPISKDSRITADLSKVAFAIVLYTYLHPPPKLA